MEARLFPYQPGRKKIVGLWTKNIDHHAIFGLHIAILLDIDRCPDKLDGISLIVIFFIKDGKSHSGIEHTHC